MKRKIRTPLLACMIVIGSSWLVPCAAEPSKSLSQPSVQANPNDSLQLSGVIVDEKTAEPIAGATITYAHQTCYSDLEGHFNLAIKPDKADLLFVSMISYEDKALDIKKEQPTALQIKLKQR